MKTQEKYVMVGYVIDNREIIEVSILRNKVLQHEFDTFIKSQNSIRLPGSSSSFGILCTTFYFSFCPY